jgi:hypothetical protein
MDAMSKHDATVVMMAVALVAVLGGAVIVAAANEDRTVPMKCNGLAELCDRRIDQVTFAGTHNSMAARKEGWLAPNQQNGIPVQLRSGIRALLIDTQYWETEPTVNSVVGGNEQAARQLMTLLGGPNREMTPGPLLCHTFCALGHRPLADGLAEIRSFLDANRYEVLIVIVEDSIRSADMDAAMRDSGLIKYAYVHDQRNRPALPTPRELIERNERLLMVVENGRGGVLSYTPPAWTLIQDTSFRYPSIDAFDCWLNRGTGQSPLLLMNHWVFSIIPSEKNAAAANRYDVLKRRAELCVEQRGQLPNIIAVDFAEKGDLLRLVRELNMERR